MPSYTELMNSTFLDAFGANQYTAAQYAAMAAGPSAEAEAVLADLFQNGDFDATVTTADPGDRLTIALVLNRQNEPTDLLTTKNWAERQAVLADQKAVFEEYGASESTFDTVEGALGSVVGSDALDDAADAGFKSSAENRTIWATITAQEFQELFGTALMYVEYTEYDTASEEFETYATYAWYGNLGLDGSIDAEDIGGVWLEMDVVTTNPQVLDSMAVTLEPGPLGIGNDAGEDYRQIATPEAIARNYGFPLADDVETTAIAVIEGGTPDYDSLFKAYNDYRHAVGLHKVSEEKFQVVSGGGTASSAGGELTLDISTIAGAARNSTQLIYNTLGGTPFAAYQNAFFDHENDPHVLTSSYSALTQSTAESPFYWAWQQLFVDGALRNVSVHNAAGDQGATGYIYNGVSNVTTWQTSPFALQVGGTSISGRYSAGFDETLGPWLPDALADDPQTLFGLVAAGLKRLPSTMSDVEPQPIDASKVLETLFETVWQSTIVDEHDTTAIKAGLGANETGSGGIAPLVPIPGYQHDFGLSGMTGGKRGMPDVAALAGGNTEYAVLNNDYVTDPSESVLSYDGGTSASTPLWAALTAQIDTIFRDQRLPHLGYYNDLLYNAAAIAPASFNDITMGDNNNTFYTSTTSPDLNLHTNLNMVTTGQGYSAQAGYDLVTGLGTPNGTILARTLTAIAHAQKSYADLPPVLELDELGAWSAVSQSLLVQTTTPADKGTDVFVEYGSSDLFYRSAATGQMAWSSQLAGQSLQHDFAAGLTRLFDAEAQGAARQITLEEGDSLAITIGSSLGQTVQGKLTTDFGFVDFMVPSDTGSVPTEMVRVARPIAIAETVDGENDQAAIVRMRQDGTDSLSIMFYRVDDLVGSVGGHLPGTVGYAAAAEARAYHSDKGTTSTAGPGYGEYSETRLLDVDSGHLIAMRLTNLTTDDTYWGFSQANEGSDGQPVVHLWHYALNTWGWEDRRNGGDGDFNDLVVGLDFTSAFGNGWLV